MSCKRYIGGFFLATGIASVSYAYTINAINGYIGYKHRYQNNTRKTLEIDTNDDKNK